MRILLTALLLAPGIVAAQQSDFASPQSEAWYHIPFDVRERLFESEMRDPDWAPSMEEEVEQEMGNRGRPHLDTVECRSTLCKVELSWAGVPRRQEVGPAIGTLWGLGLDHQGEANDIESESRYQVVLIVRHIPE